MPYPTGRCSMRCSTLHRAQPGYRFISRRRRRHGVLQHAGLVIVCDGSDAAAKRIRRVLWNDPPPASCATPMPAASSRLHVPREQGLAADDRAAPNEQHPGPAGRRVVFRHAGESTSTRQRSLAPPDRSRIEQASALVAKLVASGDVAYGINTGVWPARADPHSQRAARASAAQFSVARRRDRRRRRCRVRLILALKINALARGHSGVTLGLVEALLALEHEVYPVIPAQGSVGASGDLAPLAHLSATPSASARCASAANAVRHGGLHHAGLQPIKLHAKKDWP